MSVISHCSHIVLILHIPIDFPVLSEKGVLICSTTTVNLSIYPFSYVSFCLMCFEALLLMNIH